MTVTNAYHIDVFRVRNPGTGYKYYRGMLINSATREGRILRKRFKTSTQARAHADRAHLRLVRVQQLAQQIKE